MLIGRMRGNHRGRSRVPDARAGLVVAGSTVVICASVLGASAAPTTAAATSPQPLPLDQAAAVAAGAPMSLGGVPSQARVDTLGGSMLQRFDDRRQTRKDRLERRLRPAKIAKSGVPRPALRAYHRAEMVLADVDKTCRIDWSLLAGIGRVESDHGRYGGAVVRKGGVSDPLIRGIALDGGPGIAAISDSDDGRLDGDRTWDRAVGPMQFIPTTWDVVGTDGDGDGKANPDDLDDAALAAGVYLCAGGGDLSTRSGVADAVMRYNHSTEYVALVTSYADAYAAGDWPDVLSTTPGEVPTPLTDDDLPAGPASPNNPLPPTGSNGSGGSDGPQFSDDGEGGSGGNGGGGGNGGEPTIDEEPNFPTDPGTGGGDNGGGGGDNGGGGGGGDDPVTEDDPHVPTHPDDGDGTGQPWEPEEPQPPKPVTRTLTFSGVPSLCDGVWCVGGSYVGDLASVAGGLGDLDGDCAVEDASAELSGLAEAGASVTATIEQTSVAGEVVKTVPVGFDAAPLPCEEPAEPEETTGPDGPAESTEPSGAEAPAGDEPGADDEE